MREASKAGASGLGGTSETEIAMLQSAIAGIKDPTITTEAYQENLKIIIDTTANIRDRLMGSWQETYGEDYKEPGGRTPRSYPTASPSWETQAKRPMDIRARNREMLQDKLGGALGITREAPTLTPNDKMRRGDWKIEKE
jgi:hypothetical protein